MNAGAPCLTGGACAAGERVTPSIRSMREKDGRCVGCGRAVASVGGIDPKTLREWSAELDALAQPKTSAPSCAPVEVATSDGSEPVNDGAEPDPLETPEKLEDRARSALADPSVTVEALVDAVVQLTHKIHGCIDGKHDERARELRAQRALAKAEIVRRAS